MRERDGSESESCGTGTGLGLTTAGLERDEDSSCWKGYWTRNDTVEDKDETGTQAVGPVLDKERQLEDRNRTVTQAFGPVGLPRVTAPPGRDQD